MCPAPGVPRRLACAVAILLLVSAPGAAETRRVAAGGSLQVALDAAQPGDVVLLAAGATFTGNFILRKKTGDGFVTVQTEVDEAGPFAPGTRLTPAAAAKLARLQSPNSSAALQTAPYAHHWRIQLLQFGPNFKGYGEIIRIGDGSAEQHTLEVVPHTIVLDRLYVTGDPLLGQKRGIALNAANVAVTNSHISEIKAIGQDTQAIGIWNGPGPFVIENNYLEASGENVLLGGSGPDIPNLVPTGLALRRNHLSRPVSWRDPIVAAPAGATADAVGTGSLAPASYTYAIVARRPAGQTSYAQSSPIVRLVTLSVPGAVKLTWSTVAGATEYGVYRTGPAGTTYWKAVDTAFTDDGTAGTAGLPPGTGTRWLVKNLFELKNARNVVAEYNLFEHNWENGQVGYAIVFTVRNSSGTCTWCTIENVDFRYNVVRHVAGALNILGYDSPEISEQGRDIRITHNLFYDVNPATWGGTGIFLLMGDEPRNVTVDHNTIDHSGSSLVSVYGGPPENRREILGFRFTNNLARHGKYGIFGAGSSTGLPTIAMYLPDAQVVRNLISEGVASKYPAGNFFLPVFDSQFVSVAAGDFRLIESSPFRSAGTDGADLGVDLTRVKLAFAAAAGTPVGATPPAAPSGLHKVTGGTK